MTEGIVAFSGRSSVAELTDKNGEVSCGTVPAQTRLKICASGSHQPLLRGEVGEVHSAGPTVARGYIGKDTGEYYDEDGLRWCASGDMGCIDEKGRLFIVSRYKEMIIRGGENISPVAVEVVIGERLPHLRGLTVQIVGAADTIAGEVPVAVVAQKFDSETIQEIRSTVAATMGRIYDIDEVIYLGDLGLNDFPRTIAGKIQRTKLKEIVNKYRQQRELTYTPLNEFAKILLVDQVTSIWARIVGTRSSEVSFETALSDMADSIVLLSAKDKLYLYWSRSYRQQDAGSRNTRWATSPSGTRISSTITHNTEEFRPKDGPPTIDDMVHAVDDEEIFNTTKDLITRTIKPYGL